jgi:Cof subfamily protein (haloacid dehalogenase superfamily)
MTYPKISLVISDVDGTLITPDKAITPAAKRAVQRIREKHVKFAIASSRPARGLKFIADELDLDTPVSGFNGGRIIAPDGAVIENLRLPSGTAGQMVDTMNAMGISVWLFAGDEWYITDAAGPRVDHETRSIRYDPIVVPTFDNALLDDAVKLVGVNMDFDLVKRGEDAITAALGTQVSATRSQPFYLDITHIEATKGEVVKRLARHFGIPTEEVLTIGDGENDVLMFRQSGYSFAMGNASDKVKAEAKDVTTSNKEEGFATAMNRVFSLEM